MKLINKLIDQLPVEIHAVGYNFCGPGTKLQKRLARGDRPINKLDAACLTHDLAYAQDNDLEHRRQADLELSNIAGERFRSSDASFGEKLTAAVVKTAMVAKRKLGAGLKRRKVKKTGKKQRSNVGVSPRILPPARFGAGRRGGFLVPAAAALTAGLGAIKTIRDIRNAKRILEEQERHNKALEKIAKERGVRIGAGGGKKKTGGKLKRKRRGKCNKKKTSPFL